MLICECFTSAYTYICLRGKRMTGQAPTHGHRHVCVWTHTNLCLCCDASRRADPLLGRLDASRRPVLYPQRLTTHGPCGIGYRFRRCGPYRLCPWDATPWEPCLRAGLDASVNIPSEVTMMARRLIMIRRCGLSPGQPMYRLPRYGRLPLLASGMSRPQSTHGRSFTSGR